MTGKARAYLPLAALLLSGLGAMQSRGAQTRFAVSTPADLQHGEAEGVGVTTEGRLFLAPRVAPFAESAAGTVPSHVFCAAADDAGGVFLATGPDGEVVRVASDGHRTVVFRVDEPLVTAIAVLPSGDLLVASAPGGRIYRIRPDGKGSVWCETKERYVWALALDADGSVFAATGERGRLLKIDRNGNPAVFFDSDETHLVSLALAGHGGVWAGGSARGLVYRVDADGHALVVYDDELPEARAILAAPTGELYVAFDAPPTSEKRPTALRLRMAGSAAGSRDAMTDLDSRQTPAFQGIIEGLPSTESDDTLPLRGKVVRVSPDGTVIELWQSRDEAPFAMTLDDKGRTLIATGEPAKLWRAEGPKETTLLATLREGQATAFTKTARSIVAVTSNPAAAYRVETESASSGTFLATPADAGSVARWGTLSWHSGGSGGRVELSTRTGNCEEPDHTWSAWSPARTDADGSPVDSPEGRFLQWRATFAGVPDQTSSIVAVTVSYVTRNRAPSIRDLRIEPASRAIAAKAAFRWSATDPDGDGVTVDVEARAVGAKEWKRAVRTDSTQGNDGSSKDGRATWDTATWDEGLYEVRAVASDQPSNPLMEGRDGETTLPLFVFVDRTAPSIEATRKGDSVEVVVNDGMSGVTRLELLADGRVSFSPRCADGVCDGHREAFHVLASQMPNGSTFSLRATDAAGNSIESGVPAP